MAGKTADEGHGISIALTTSAWAPKLIDAEWSGITVESIETTDMSVTTPAAGSNTRGNKTYIPSDLIDPGVLTITSFANTLQAGDTDQPPAGLVLETLTLTWPKAAGDATAATWSADAFCVDYSVRWASEEAIIQTTVWKLSGNITIVAAA